VEKCADVSVKSTFFNAKKPGLKNSQGVAGREPLKTMTSHSLHDFLAGQNKGGMQRKKNIHD
jgi:hypothetical protein